MTTTLLVMQIAQWIMLALVAIVTLALARQIGLLQRRLPPAPARPLRRGTQVGASVPVSSTLDIDGQQAYFVNPGRHTLLVFLSPTCSTCDELVPALRSVARSERKRLETIVVSLSSENAARAYAAQHNISSPVVAGLELADELDVHGAPYACVIDEHGIFLAAGIVNGMDHLESLLYTALAEPGTSTGKDLDSFPGVSVKEVS